MQRKARAFAHDCEIDKVACDFQFPRSMLLEDFSSKSSLQRAFIRQKALFRKEMLI